MTIITYEILFHFFQRVLVSLGRHDEALAIAERACTRAFIDYLLERQAGAEGLYRGNIDPPPVTPGQITNIVGKQQALVLYYSIAAGYLYCWLVTPRNGKTHSIVRYMTYHNRMYQCTKSQKLLECLK